MDDTMLIEHLECSSCDEPIPDGSTVFVLCPLCAMALLDIPDANQLTLFELPPTTEIH